jgi:hypothetical protein
MSGDASVSKGESVGEDIVTDALRMPKNPRKKR